MAIIKKKLTSELLANKAKEFAMRRINNRADITVRLRLMNTVVCTLCTDNVHLVIDDVTLHRLIWIPLRAGSQDDISLLLNITSDILTFAAGYDITREDLTVMLGEAYGDIGPSKEWDPDLDDSNLFADQSASKSIITELLESNPWYITVILLSASDIRAELIATIANTDKE